MDDTRLLSGAPGDHVVLARRSGERWFGAYQSFGDVRLSFPGLPERAADYRRELDVERVDGDLLTFSAKAGEPYRIG